MIPFSIQPQISSFSTTHSLFTMKTKSNARPITSAATLIALALTVGPAAAAVTFHNGYSGTATEVFSSTELAYAADVSNSDLINGMIPVHSGWQIANEAHPNELTDGIHGATFGVVSGDRVQGAWTNPNAVATYTLGLGPNDLGFDIASIQSIASWRDAAYGNQAWTLSVQLVGSDSFVNVATIDYQPLETDAGGATKVTLTDLNITGIQALRVTANSITSPNNRFVWRELDVFGAAAIPEPSTVLLLGIGGLALLRRRRHC